MRRITTNLDTGCIDSCGTCGLVTRGQALESKKRRKMDYQVFQDNLVLNFDYIHLECRASWLSMNDKLT